MTSTKASSGVSLCDPDADYFLDGEDGKPVSGFEVLMEIAADMADRYTVSIDIKIEEPGSTYEGVSMGIAKEVRIRLLERAAVLFESEDPTKDELAMAKRYRDKVRELRGTGVGHGE